MERKTGRSSCYLAVFDISLDRERAKVAKILEGFGFRVQKSVFECRLTRGGFERLRRTVEKLDLKSGTLLLYKAGNEFRLHSLGQPADDRHRASYAYVV